MLPTLNLILSTNICPSLVVSPDTLLPEVIQRLANSQEHPSYVLIQDSKEIVGLFREQDLVQLLAQGRSLENLLIREVMISPAPTLNIDHINTQGLMRLFKEYSTPCFVVQDHQFNFLGLVTPYHLLSAFSQNQDLEFQPSVQEQVQKEASETQEQPTSNSLITAIATKLRSAFSLEKTLRLAVEELAVEEQEKRFESELRLGQITDSIPGAVFQYQLMENGEERLLFMSRGIHELFESSLEHFRSDPQAIWTCILPEDHDSVAKSVQLSATNLSIWEHEFRVRTPKGNFKWIGGKSIPSLQADGSVVWNGIFLDITSSKLEESSRRLLEQDLYHREIILQRLNEDLEDLVQERTQAFLVAQQNLRKNEQLLLSIYKGIPYPIFVYDVSESGEFYNVGINPACELAIGKRNSEVIGKTLEEIFDPVLSKILRNDFMQCLETKDFVCYEECKKFQDSESWWLTTINPMKDGSDQIHRIVGTAYEITDRKKNEALQQEHLTTLVEWRNRYETAGLASGQIIYEWDIKSNRFTWGPNTKEILGYESSEMPTCNEELVALIHPEESKIFQAELEQSLTNKTSLKIEYRLRRKDGVYLWIENSSQIFVNIMEEFTSLVGFISDISDRKQADVELREMNAQLSLSNSKLALATRLKDEFLANMSHELRTPLNVILGMTEALLEEILGSLNEKQIKALQKIDKSGTHLLELINDILDLAKIESGYVKFSPEFISLYPICQSSLVYIEQQALNKNIQVELKLPVNLPNLWGDPKRISQILINLLTNAVKFTPEGGRITLEASLLPHVSQEAEGLTKTVIRIVITDTGIGIAPEYIPKLFQPFVQIDSALNRKYAGTGLGLSLVKRLVELHGGTVSLASEPGVGSRFTIDLPCEISQLGSLQPQNLVQTNLSLSPSEQHDHTLILLAEDNIDSAETVMAYLKTKGYDLLWAKDGQEAVSLTQTEKLDLILMDIQMPGMDGLEAIHLIRHDPNCANVPIIALTALAMPEDHNHCMAAGATDYLSKPFKMKQLVDKIQHILASDRSVSA